MAKGKTRYVCQACGAVAARWAGQCADCKEWNTLAEEAAPVFTPFAAKQSLQSGGRRIAMESLADDVALPPRLSTGIVELDRALGGGLVPGSVTLIGGDPGIGKSTLLLQAAGKMARANEKTGGASVAYVSGEEAADQVRLRARRLGLAKADVALASETNVRDILTTLTSAGAPPGLLVIDSIQTMHSDTLEGAPGTVSQVRASAQELIRAFEAEQIAKQAKDLPDIYVGDTVRVGVRITEGNKERIQPYEGVVIAKRHGGLNETITVRRIFQGVGVERVFLLHSPQVASVKVERRGKVRRAKLFYLRDRVGKATRVKQRFDR